MAPITRSSMLAYQPPTTRARALTSPVPRKKPKFEHVEDITNALQDVGAAELVTTPIEAESRLLRLPLEIRLQIYGYIIDLHPTNSTHLAPNPGVRGLLPGFIADRSSAASIMGSFSWCGRGRSLPESFYFQLSPTQLLEAYNTYPLLVKIKNDAFFKTEDPSNAFLGSTGKQMPAPGPEVCNLPTSFLLTNKQICDECRLLPFQRNNFVFLNNFNSGVYTATAFARTIREWQRDAVRYIGLEVGGVELVGKNGSCEPAWLECCGLWKGIWGLSLTVKGDVGGYGVLVPSIDSVQGTGGDTISDTSGHVAPPKFITKSVLDIDADWITKGLSQMTSLRYLELAFVDPKCGSEEKVKFCADLEAVLGGVRVRWRELVRVEKADGWESNWVWQDFGLGSPPILVETRV